MSDGKASSERKKNEKRNNKEKLIFEKETRQENKSEIWNNKIWI